MNQLTAARPDRAHAGRCGPARVASSEKRDGQNSSPTARKRDRIIEEAQCVNTAFLMKDLATSWSRLRVEMSRLGTIG
jgi:hypothetical protein